MDAHRKRLGEELFGLLFDHTTEGVIVVALDGSGELLEANRRVEDLTGYALHAVLGTNVQILLGDDWRSLIERPGLHEDVACNRVDGYPIYVAITVAHVEHGSRGHLAACLVRDATERRLLERELLAKHSALYAAHADLERAVAKAEERNRELTLLGGQLSAATRRALIGELSAGIAHSLNNPLAAMASAQKQLATLVAERGGTLIDEAARYLKRTRDAIARMEQVVADVRRVQRAGSAAGATARQVKLSDEIGNALALFEARTRRIEVAIDLRADVAFVPPNDLQHILWNLVDNALQAMPDGGRLSFTSRSDGDTTLLVVEDSGAGVAESVLPSLFEAFATARPGGHGLGLSTARRLARCWGGDLRLLRATGGAAFAIHLPSKEQSCLENASLSSTTMTTSASR